VRTSISCGSVGQAGVECKQVLDFDVCNGTATAATAPNAMRSALVRDGGGCRKLWTKRGRDGEEDISFVYRSPTTIESTCQM